MYELILEETSHSCSIRGCAWRSITLVWKILFWRKQYV